MIPVVDKEQKPLMPTSPKRARQMIISGKATPFFKKGIFCIRLNIEPSARNIQPVAIGIDPGSKKEGFTVKSAKHTFLNINADAVTWVKNHVETRRTMRRGRRFRKTPYRSMRPNRARGGISPSTKARWQSKLRLIEWLVKIFPVTDLVVEDIKAISKGKRKWDVSFSPLEVGKKWFYEKLRAIGTLTLRQGWETKNLRDILGLKKSKAKMEEIFSAHCVDSWVLAREAVGGENIPSHTDLFCITPLEFHRRQLHRLQPEKGGKRKSYGSTRSLGFKRGSLVKHPTYGVVYIGGNLKGRLSLHSLETGKRLTQRAKSSDCRFLCFNAHRWHRIISTKTGILPVLKGGVSAPKTR